MKKITLFLLSLISIFCFLTACNSNDNCVHTFSDWTTLKVATCFEDGELVRFCSKCSLEEKTTIIKTNNHKFVTYISDGNATTETDGTKTARCENIGCSATDTIIDEGSKLSLDCSLGLTYITYRNGYAVSGIGSCTDTTIVIPSEYNGLPVVAIAENCFKSKSNIQAIIIPNSVLIIEKYAIAYCKNLNQVDLGEGVKEIGMSFAGCDALKSIKVPASVEIIDNLAFYLSENLESIIVDDNNNFYSSQDGILYNKAKTEVICCPANSSVNNLELPSTVVTIGSYSFVDCKNLEKVTMSNNVTTIESSAFSGCSKLESIVMSNNITKIENWAFENCTSLKSCVVPNGVTLLYSYVFQDCAGLEWIYISKNLTHIGYNPFDRCTSLRTIYFGGTSTQWNNITYSSTTPSYIGINFVFEHDMTCNHEIVIDEARNPTCSLEGLTEGSHCKICDAIIVEQEKIPTIDHIEEIILAIEPTCSSVGYTQGTRCLMCKESIIAPIEVPKISHTEEIIPSVKATCSSTGYTQGKKCSVCKTIIVQPLQTGFANHITKDVAEIKATCTSSGATAGKICTVCNNIVEGCIFIEPLPHEYVDGVCDVCDTQYYSSGFTFKRYSDYNGLKNVSVISSYSGGDTEVYIPRYDDTRIIVGIGASTFSDKTKITKIKMFDNIKYIENYAFEDCSNLTKISISNSVVSIGKYAFSRCSKLQDITIPNSVTSLGDYAFNRCTSLTSIILSSSINTIGMRCFDGCSKLTIKCELSSRLSEWHSSWNSSNRPIIWNYNTPNEMLNNGKTATGYGWRLSDDGEISIIDYTGSSNVIEFPNKIGIYPVTTIGDSLFYYNRAIQEVIVPNGIVCIEDNAFYSCTGLVTIKIPNTVAEIGKDAFNSCISLNNVKYLGSIDEWVQIKFENVMSNPLCYAPNLYIDNELVTEAIISTSNKISSYAFASFYGSTSSLSSIVIKNSVVLIEEGAFSYNSGITSINIADSVTNIGNYAFEYCQKLQEVTIGKNVTLIGNGAFEGCEKLYNVIISNGVQTIGSQAFMGCVGLSNINIPNSVTSIGYDAFRGCTSLKNVSIPDSVLSMGSGVFSDCSCLETITLGSGAYRIENEMFSGCSKLSSITIPATITYIGYDAFEGCSKLAKINYTGTIEEWQTIQNRDSYLSQYSYEIICTNGSIFNNK